MAVPTRLSFDVSAVETPAIVCDLSVLRRNLELLAWVQQQAECKILLALKGFAMWSVFPLVGRHLRGAAASSPHEARLAREELGGEVHVYAPAYSEADLQQLVGVADHVVFNSLSQWRRLRPIIEAHGPGLECGLRINPEHSEVEAPIYDPCARFSRLGVTREQLRLEDLDGLDGLHVHNLCEKGAEALARTLAAVTEKFGPELARVGWVNLGGGHLITRPGYDVELLVRSLREFARRYGVAVYLEPGEAIALNAGVLIASVLDIVQNEMPIAVLDTSAAAHMPDVLEMPYRPDVLGAGAAGEHSHTYRLGGLTCLAGDVIGDYSFPQPLRVGDRVVFADMAHYTMVKSSTFNGVRLPSIVTFDPDGSELKVVRRFGYGDYRSRLS
jgi:carboxynorspermidine decarboxylase